ncbi:MAG: glycosyltransferase family 9 protein [Pseudomonadota bacterium]|nr:glycosyltransferase family 9 protein [Pseudomonadota bacterium]
MRILFISNSRIGDFILTTGLLDHLLETYPQAAITVVCGAICVPLLAEVPRIERVIVLRKKSFSRHWIGLWRQVIGTRWDLVIDLRNTAVSRLLRARQVRRLRRLPGSLHRVEEINQVFGLPGSAMPRLWLGPKQRDFAARLIPDGPPVIAFGPGSTHRHKQWPAERFAELALRLTASDGPFPGARVAVMGVPVERDAALPLLQAIPGCLDLIDSVPILEAAAVLERCALYIGNDNGQMHLAAATGIPVLGLFGPTPAQVYRPWGKRAAFVQSDQSCEELAPLFDEAVRTGTCLMTGLSVDKVLAAVRDLVKASQ